MITHEIVCPFHEFSNGPDCGWLPGCHKEHNEEYAGHVNGDATWQDGVAYIADALGHMIINEIQTVSIEGYEDRVFYTRQWRDPEGKVFGKKDLRVKGRRAFTRLLKGWRHPFYLNGYVINEK